MTHVLEDVSPKMLQVNQPEKEVARRVLGIQNP